MQGSSIHKSRVYTQRGRELTHSRLWTSNMANQNKNQSELHGSIMLPRPPGTRGFMDLASLGGQLIIQAVLYSIIQIIRIIHNTASPCRIILSLASSTSTYPAHCLRLFTNSRRSFGFWMPAVPNFASLPSSSWARRASRSSICSSSPSCSWRDVP